VARRIVLDTNVVIAGLRSKNGASFEVLLSVDDGSFRICLSIPLVFEYEAVAKRQAEATGRTNDEIDELIAYLCAVAEPVDIHYLWRPELPDSDDDMVLEAAVAGQCEFIVTHNIRDFKGIEKFGLSAITPHDFLQVMGGSK
jgi:putative PIN family toxin of toxin-antitoxin system